MQASTAAVGASLRDSAALAGEVLPEYVWLAMDQHGSCSMYWCKTTATGTQPCGSCANCLKNTHTQAFEAWEAMTGNPMPGCLAE